MHTDDDPARLSPDERRTAIARILAEGVLRLRKRVVLSRADENSENPTNFEKNRLEAVPEIPLTVHVG